MIKPTVIDVLHTVEHAITNTIKPEMSSMDGKSTIATIEHLLRHIRLRITDEGQMLTDDISALRSLCADLQAWLERQQADAACIDDVKNALGRAFREPGVYPNLLNLSGEAAVLRGALVKGLQQLQNMRATHGHSPTYQQLRQRIRDYTALQIEAEGRLIDPAYLGQGPRR